MALFFIAALGLLLFFLYLRRLADVSSPLLIAVLSWTSFSILGVSLLLFLLSGRILHATLLVFVVGGLIWNFHQKKVAAQRRKRLPAPKVASRFEEDES